MRATSRSTRKQENFHQSLSDRIIFAWLRNGANRVDNSFLKLKKIGDCSNSSRIFNDRYFSIVIIIYRIYRIFNLLIALNSATLEFKEC